MHKSVYDYQLTDIHGNVYPLSNLKGKKILLVNTASACGLTPQYAQLEELHKHYNSKVVIVGIPCNDFGAQEPGTEKEIETFCSTRYGVSFPLMGKVKILGADAHPLYQFLTQKELNGYSDSEVKWNFQKYLIDEGGQLIHVFSPMVEPLSDELIKAIDK